VIELEVMKKFLLRWHFLVVFLFVVAFISFALVSRTTAGTADSCDNNQYNVSGYAWSSNIGWIEFKGVSQSPANDCYGVHFTQNVNDNGGYFSSYAWSSGIGWIRFSPVISSGSDALPSGATEVHGVQLETDGRVSGWARACSVFKSNTCDGRSGLKDDSALGGWDGWIKMSGDWDGDGFMEPGTVPLNGATADNYVRKDSNQLRGFAWGADDIGWVDFCTATAEAENKCVILNTLSVSCSTDPADQSLIGNSVTWQANVFPVSTNYTYSWTWSDNYTPQSGSSALVTRPHNTAGRPITGTVSVVNATGDYGEAQCPIDINNQNERTLKVIIAGDPTAVSYGSVSAGTPVDANCNNSCDYPIDVTASTPTIDLTAIVGGGAPANIAFSNWSVTGDSGTSCIGSTSLCSVIMNNNVTVYAYFSDTSIISSVILGEPVPPIIRINAQNAGSAAESNKSSLNVTNSGDSDIKVCVNSIVSMETGQSIEDIILATETTFGEDYDYPSCIIYDGESTIISDKNVGCNSSQACLTIPSGVTKQVQISMKVYDKIYEILRDSPFKIEVEAKKINNQSLSPSQVKNIEFRYQVPDIRPR